MKKIIALTILLSLCLCYLYGCTNNTTPTAIGKNIDKNLTTLYNTVSNLDTIDNSYIANPDIYQIEDVSNTNVISRSIAVPERKEAKEIKIDEVSIKTDNENEEEIIYQKNNENEEKTTLPEDIDKENTEITNLNNIENEEDNKIEEIKNADETNLDNSNIENETTLQNDKTNENVTETNIDVIFEENLDENSTLDDVLIIDQNGDGTLITDNSSLENEEIPQDKLDEIFNNTLNDNSMTSDEKEKVYIFLFDKIRYTPRYASNYNTDIAQTTLNNYLYKVQELYTMTADVVEANNVLSDEKEELLNCIENLKIINNKLINGEIIPNNQQLIALNNYVQDVKTTIKRIKASNGQLNNEINNISTTSSNYGLSKGVDIINSNYLKILNHIDARITYFKSALATLNQMDYILKEAQLQINYNINEDIINEDDTTISQTTNEMRKLTSNIDTYKNGINYVENANGINTENNNQNINSKNNKNIDTFNNNNQNTEIYNNNNVYDNNYNNNVNNINENNVNGQNYVNNNVPNGNVINNNLPIYGEDVNTPNGTFQNGIITQNNLNNGTNNGVYGNGTGYANGAGYVDYYKQNNFQRTDRNVNTYGRNTLVDMINNGTVNNGINTLNVESTSSNKPVMVDNEIDCDENCNLLNTNFDTNDLENNNNTEENNILNNIDENNEDLVDTTTTENNLKVEETINDINDNIELSSKIENIESLEKTQIEEDNEDDVKNELEDNNDIEVEDIKEDNEIEETIAEEKLSA